MLGVVGYVCVCVCVCVRVCVCVCSLLWMCYGVTPKCLCSSLKLPLRSPVFVFFFIVLTLNFSVFVFCFVVNL